jgi:integrase
VHQSLEQLKGGGFQFKGTKTRRSRRAVPLTAEAIALLKAHRAEQNAVRLQAPGYNAEGLLFPDPSTGLPWKPDHFSTTFGRRARRIGINVTFHGLRHSFATIALRARVPMKVVSDILGHTTTALTADLYTHVLEDMQHQAADAVGAALMAAQRVALNR